MISPEDWVSLSLFLPPPPSVRPSACACVRACVRPSLRGTLSITFCCCSSYLCCYRRYCGTIAIVAAVTAAPPMVSLLRLPLSTGVVTTLSPVASFPPPLPVASTLVFHSHTITECIKLVGIFSPNLFSHGGGDV